MKALLLFLFLLFVFTCQNNVKNAGAIDSTENTNKLRNDTTKVLTTVENLADKTAFL